MSLSTFDLVPSTPRHGRTTVRTHAPATRRRLRNARRALALVPAPRPEGVRLHPVELGPWDD